MAVLKKKKKTDIKNIISWTNEFVRKVVKYFTKTKCSYVFPIIIQIESMQGQNVNEIQTVHILVI